MVNWVYRVRFCYESVEKLRVDISNMNILFAANCSFAPPKSDIHHCSGELIGNFAGHVHSVMSTHGNTNTKTRAKQTCVEAITLHDER